jgi:hypothetical protein
MLRLLWLSTRVSLLAGGRGQGDLEQVDAEQLLDSTGTVAIGGHEIAE